MHELVAAIEKNTSAVKDLLRELRERYDERTIYNLLLAQSASLVKRFRRLDAQTLPSKPNPNTK